MPHIEIVTRMGTRTQLTRMVCSRQSVLSDSIIYIECFACQLFRNAPTYKLCVTGNPVNPVPILAALLVCFFSKYVFTASQCLLFTVITCRGEKYR